MKPSKKLRPVLIRMPDEIWQRFAKMAIDRLMTRQALMAIILNDYLDKMDKTAQE